MTSSLVRFEQRAVSAGGRVSAVVLDASGREVFTLSPDEPMPAASVIKLPLVMTLFADAAAGRMDLDERVAIGQRVGGSGVLSHLPDVPDMTLRDLAAITTTVSDNTATNRLIDRVGIVHVNERLDEWGCPATRLRRAMFDLEAKARGIENAMTARDAASLLRRVLEGAVAGEHAWISVLSLLTWNGDRTRLGRYLPPSVPLAHKDGWGDDPLPVDNDVGIVRAGRGASTGSAADALRNGGAVVVGFTHGVDPLVARPLLGLLGRGAAEAAGAELGPLPFEVGGNA